MKTDRHKKILELIDRYEIGTQEELAKILNDEGYMITTGYCFKRYKRT